MAGFTLVARRRLVQLGKPVTRNARWITPLRPQRNVSRLKSTITITAAAGSMPLLKAQRRLRWKL